jgi:tetratricopeptide (TPR) repeat protein
MVLPFEELSPLQFERLTLWLVERESYLRPQHLGEAGSEQGRDLTAYKRTAGGEELWFFQCKRHKKISAAALKREVDKYNGLAATDPSQRPAGVVFVTSAAISSRIREEVHAYCNSHGYACEFWARSELDLRVKKYPEIVAEFFNASVVAPSPALHQLPPPPRDFAGRSSELAELSSAVEQGATIIGLFGMGGVGKTALALKLAELLAPGYPDAQIYLDLRGASLEPIRLSDVRLHVIRSYRQGTAPPREEAEAASLFRSFLHGQRAILVLDNAAGREQVEELIPPSGCLLLVTSRKRFHLPGAFSLNIEPMSREESRDLLLAIAPRIGSQGDAIADLCGRLPLALRLAAAALAERVDVSATDYARRLSNTQRRLELVEASFRLSYDLLTPAGQELWRKLAVFPGTFDSDGAAYVWGFDADTARMILSEMVRLSMLEWDARNSRYRLHDLARLYAGDRLSNGERRDAHVRHANYYGALLQEAHSLYGLGGAAVARALSNVDTEWDNIRGAQAWAQENTETDDEAAGMCNAFPNAGAYLLDLRQRPSERIRWLEAALAAARRLNLRLDEGAHLANLGIAHTAMGQPRRAIELLELSLDIDRELGHREGEAHVLGSLGNAYSALGDVRRAIEFYEQDLEIIREFDDRRSEGMVLNNLGIAYAAIGEPGRALTYYERALSIFREAKDPHGEGGVLGSLGLFYTDQGQERLAVQLHQQELSIYRGIGYAEGEQHAFNNLGHALYQLGDYRGAIDCHQRQLDIARNRDDRRGEGQALSGMGSAYYSLGDDRSSAECHEQALAIFRELGDRLMEGRVLGNWGNLCSRAGDAKRALELYDTQLVLARETGDRRSEANALWNKGWSFSKQDNLTEAIAHGGAALKIYEEIKDQRQAAIAREHLSNWRK